MDDFVKIQNERAADKMYSQIVLAFEQAGAFITEIDVRRFRCDNFADVIYCIVDGSKKLVYCTAMCFYAQDDGRINQTICQINYLLDTERLYYTPDRVMCSMCFGYEGCVFGQQVINDTVKHFLDVCKTVAECKFSIKQGDADPCLDKICDISFGKRADKADTQRVWNKFCDRLTKRNWKYVCKKNAICLSIENKKKQVVYLKATLNTEKTHFVILATYDFSFADNADGAAVANILNYNLYDGAFDFDDHQLSFRISIPLREVVISDKVMDNAIDVVCDTMMDFYSVVSDISQGKLSPNVLIGGDDL